MSNPCDRPPVLTSMGDIFASLENVSKQQPGSVALASPGGHITFDNFQASIDRAASTALQGGIRPGELIVLAIKNPDVAFILALALMRIGCRVGYSANWHLCDRARIRVDAFVADENIETGGRRLIVVDSAWFKGAVAADADMPPATNACSLITSSSGSTGAPKLIETSGEAIVRWIERMLAEELTTPGMRTLIMTGDRLRGSFCETLASQLRGGMLLRARDRRGPTILETIQLYCPDYLAISPLVLVDMLKTLSIRNTRLSRIEKIRSVGAYIAPELQNACLQHLADSVFTAYGATECGWITRGSVKDLQHAPNCVGRIYDDVEVATFDGDGHRLPAGARGEIWVKVPEGHGGRYLGDDRDNQLKGDWFATGDIGFVDPDNFLIVLGRANNVINVGGDKINPEQLEEQLTLMHPNITDAGVVGIRGRHGFDQVCALVVANATVEKNAVNHILAKGGLWPVDIVKTVTAIPRTDNGKIDRVALKELCLPEAGDDSVSE